LEKEIYLQILAKLQLQELQLENQREIHLEEAETVSQEVVVLAPMLERKEQVNNRKIF